LKRASSFLPVLLCACVTQGTFDKLKAEYDESQAQLEAKNKTIRDYETKTAEMDKQANDLRAEIEKEKGNVADLQSRITQLDAERAEMLKKGSKLEASVTEMTAALADLQKRKQEADARLAEYKGLLEKFKSLIDAGKLKVKIIDGRMVVVLASDVLFKSGSADLSDKGKAAVAEVSSLLASIPKRKFQVEGHTDNVPIKTAEFPSNWELASARAINVVKTMIESGMPHDRISAASFGDGKPTATNSSPDGRAQNRRIEIIVVPDLSTLPGFDELNKVQKS
jgi:chemotaxis protein MotB